MSAKIRPLPTAPEWFNLDEYLNSASEIKTPLELANQLIPRKSLLWTLENADKYPITGKGKIAYDVKAKACREKVYPKPYYIFKQMVENGISEAAARGARYYGDELIREPVQELDFAHVFRLRGMLPEDDRKNLEKDENWRNPHTITPMPDLQEFKDINEASKKSFSDRCISIYEKGFLESAMPQRPVYLEIDLLADNEALKKSLIETIKKIRKRNGLDSYTAHRDAISESKIRDIMDSGLLPYLDLKIWSMEKELGYVWEDYAEIFNQNSNKHIDTESFRQTISKHESRCMNHKFIQNLVTYYQRHPDQT